MQIDPTWSDDERLEHLPSAPSEEMWAAVAHQQTLRQLGATADKTARVPVIATSQHVFLGPQDDVTTSYVEPARSDLYTYRDGSRIKVNFA